METGDEAIQLSYMNTDEAVAEEFPMNPKLIRREQQTDEELRKNTSSKNMIFVSCLKKFFSYTIKTPSTNLLLFMIRDLEAMLFKPKSPIRPFQQVA